MGKVYYQYIFLNPQVHSFDQARLDERVQKIETNLYSANPELRELLDGVCLIDEDREKQLRYCTVFRFT